MGHQVGPGRADHSSPPQALATLEPSRRHQRLPMDRKPPRTLPGRAARRRGSGPTRALPARHGYTGRSRHSGPPVRRDRPAAPRPSAPPTDGSTRGGPRTIPCAAWPTHARRMTHSATSRIRLLTAGACSAGPAGPPPLTRGHQAVKTGLLLERGNELYGAPGCPRFAGPKPHPGDSAPPGRQRMFAWSGGGQRGNSRGGGNDQFWSNAHHDRCA
jgi:hypothetical protein